MKYFYLLFLLLTLHSASSAFAQQDSIPVEELVEKNNTYITQYPSESVHVHFDKPYYALGDTIWFKAYITTIQRYPSPLSKILYVDVINTDNTIAESLKLPVTNSTSHGSVVLDPLVYKQGNYRIRAYTQWMLNFSSDYFFQKNLVVGNAINKKLNTHITISKESSGKNNKIKVKIGFQDERFMPLRGKKVSWEAIAFLDRLGRGKSTTDDQGFIEIEFTSAKDKDLEGADLTATLDMGDNKTIETKVPLQTMGLTYDVQFFPEGGSLIDGIPTQVAFKAIRSDGLGIEATGSIVDAEGNSIADLRTEHLGMGKCAFVPIQGKTYFANLNFSDGSTGTYTLPKVATEGIALSVTRDSAETLKVAIKCNDAFLKKHFNTGFYIVGRSGGNIYYAAQSVLRNQQYAISVPEGNFPSGIVQLSVLATNGQTLSERLVFVRRPDTLQMNLKADLPSYKPRQQIKMSLDASLGGQPVLGNFSVAVIDETKVPVNEDKEATIWSSLLLRSELQGYIEQPNYYFHHVNDQKRAHLDLLMLTQGYRKYLYKDVVANTPPTISFLPEQGLAITGMIRKSNGLPLENTKILLQIPEKSFYKDGMTDSKGRFRFDNLLFPDSVKAVVNARSVNERNLIITVDGEPMPAVDKNINVADEVLNIDSALHTYLKNNPLQNSTGFLLEEVEIKATAKRPSHTDHAALSGLNMQADYFTDGEQLSGCNNLLTCMSTVMGLTYIDNQLYLSTAYNAGSRVPVEIYANGMPVDVNYLYSIQPGGVESIEVFKDDGLTGINQRSNTQGVVVINMKEIKTQKMSMEDFKKLFPPANTLTVTPKGYTEERQFYVPKYTGPRNSLQAKDIRSTIHWNPLLLTDEKGHIDFTYFAADDPGTYRVVIEGFDEEGILGRKEYRVEVK